MQQFALDSGAGLSLAIRPSLCRLLANKVNPEDFVSTFIPPNLTWMRAFEEMKRQES